MGGGGGGQGKKMQIANKIALKFMMWEFYCTFVMDVGFVESFALGYV